MVAELKGGNEKKKTEAPIVGKGGPRPGLSPHRHYCKSDEKRDEGTDKTQKTSEENELTS